MLHVITKITARTVGEDPADCRRWILKKETNQLKYFKEQKHEKSKDHCKADHNNSYCFFITIFWLAIPAFFRFTDGMASRNVVIKRKTRR